MHRTVLGLGALIGLFVGVAFAGDVVVSEAWTRATAPGQKVAGVYFDIESAVDAKLVGVQTSLTDAAEIHQMSIEDGVMRMRQVPAVNLPAGDRVEFKPGGYHVMLFDLEQPLHAGQQFVLSLTLSDDTGHQTEVAVEVQVRNLDGSPVGGHHH